MTDLVHYLRSGDGVLDVGCNIGDYAKGYAEIVGPTGSVLDRGLISVEAESNMRSATD